MSKNMIMLISAICFVIIVFVIVFFVLSRNPTMNENTSTTEIPVEETKKQPLDKESNRLDEEVQQFDTFCLNTLTRVGLERTTVDIIPQSEEGWSQIVRKSYLKHYVPLENANLALTELAKEQDMEIIDALEVRQPNEHYVRLWFEKNDRHTNSIILYPGKEPEPPKISPDKYDNTRQTSRKTKLAIVIDDFGVALTTTAQGFMNIKYPLTFSILPYNERIYPASKDIAREAHNNDKEVMLHFPMEPETFPTDSPGPDALYVDMEPSIKKELILRNISGIPYVKGINNHMGSKATGDRPSMEILMDILKEKNLYFVDSKTNRESVATRVALDKKVGVRENWFFLDPYGADEDYIRKKLQEAADTAKDHGSLVVIGHMNKMMLRVLEEDMEKIEKQGVEFVHVSSILR